MIPRYAIPDFSRLVANTRFSYQKEFFSTAPVSNIIKLKRSVSTFHENMTVFMNKQLLIPGDDYDRLDGNNNILPMFDDVTMAGQTTYPLIQKINIKSRINGGSTIYIIYSVFSGDYIDYGEINQYVSDRLSDVGIQEFINEYLQNNITEILENLLPHATTEHPGIIQIAELDDFESDDKAITPYWYTNQKTMQLFKFPLLDPTNSSAIISEDLHYLGAGKTSTVLPIRETDIVPGEIWSIPFYTYNKNSVHVWVGGTIVQPGDSYVEIEKPNTTISNQIRWLKAVPKKYNIDILCQRSNIDNAYILQERLYPGSFVSLGGTRTSNIEPLQNYTVPNYIVSAEQLEIYIDGLRATKGVHYNEIGDYGTSSQTINFLKRIEPAYDIVIYVKPSYSISSLYNVPAIDNLNYYISISGNDNLEGTSPSLAFRTWENCIKKLAVTNLRDKTVTITIDGKIDVDNNTVNLMNVPGLSPDNLFIKGNNSEIDGFNGILKFIENTGATINNISFTQLISEGNGNFISKESNLYIGGNSLEPAININGTWTFENVNLYLKNSKNILSTEYGNFVIKNTSFSSTGSVTIVDSLFYIGNGNLEFINASNLLGQWKTNSIISLKDGKYTDTEYFNLSTANIDYINVLNFLSSNNNIKAVARINADGTFFDSTNTLAEISGTISKTGTGKYIINHKLSNINILITLINIAPLIATTDSANISSAVNIFDLSGNSIDSDFIVQIV